MKFSLLPRDRKFFVMFEQSAQNCVKIAKALQQLMDVWENVKERVEMITALEHEGDAITHQIIANLHSTFITPFDREDIAQLAHSLDDVTDYIHATAGAMYIYRVDRPTDRAKEMVATLAQTADEMEKAIAEVRAKIDRKQLLARCVEINRLENMADGIYRSALAELFTDSKDPIFLMKWREIYDQMESAIDKCEDVADILEGVVLKYA